MASAQLEKHLQIGDILVAALSVGAPTIMLSMPLIEPILYEAELLNREVPTLIET